MGVRNVLKEANTPVKHKDIYKCQWEDGTDLNKSESPIDFICVDVRGS